MGVLMCSKFTETESRGGGVRGWGRGLGNAYWALTVPLVADKHVRELGRGGSHNAVNA